LKLSPSKKREATLFTYQGRYLADTKGSVYEVQGYYVHFRVTAGRERSLRFKYKRNILKYIQISKYGSLSLLFVEAVF